MKKPGNDRNRRNSKPEGRSGSRQTARKNDSKRRSGDDRRNSDDRSSRSRSDDKGITYRSGGDRYDDKKGKREFSGGSNESSGERSSYERKSEETVERRNSGGRNNERRSNPKRDEGTGDRRSYVRKTEFRNERGEGSFKKEDKPYKAGTRPSGRREREEGEKRPRTTTESQRDEIRKDRSFDRQDRPYKEGTQPAPRKYGYGDESKDRGDFRDRRKSSDRESAYKRTGDRGSRYGDKKNYRDSDKSYDKPSRDGKVRLNKYIANSGICSRREADDLISAGVISVNDVIITELGYKISPSDKVKYNDRPVRSEKNVYVLLNKPKDYITTTDDPQNRRTVMNLIQGAGKERLYPVGRLDRATTGVLLFTNDGELTTKLTHPSHEIRKIYQVELDKVLKSSDMDRIKDGIELEDGTTKVDEIFYNGESKKTIGVELHSGKNRIVRRIFEALDYKVVKLDRVYFAGLTKKDLTRGRWRFLTELEIANLKMLTAKKPKRTIN